MNDTAEKDAWACPRPECGAPMDGGLFCRSCGQRRPDPTRVTPPERTADV